MSRIFDCETTPLAGCKIIEASAGTGKTYSLVHAVERLIREEDVKISRLLVVTFTTAATAELSERIKKTLSESLQARVRRGEGESAEALRLSAALRDFDESCIQTIHGFCQKILQENRFTGGGDFSLETVTDETPYLDEALDEILRDALHRLPGKESFALVKSFLKDPAWADKLKKLVDMTPSKRASLRLVCNLGEEKEQGEAQGEGPDGTEEGSREQILAFYEAFFREFCEKAPERVRRIKLSYAVQGFTDMLLGTLEAIESNPEFRQRVRAMFDAVLIDEFQDTDEVQYRIFRSLFVPSEGEEAAGYPGCVIFVGDPKQSIYRFRGADIGVYLAARDEIGDEGRYLLDTNHRSSRPLVDCLNGFFGAPDSFLTGGKIVCEPVLSADGGQGKRRAKSPVLRRNPDGTVTAVPVFEVLLDDKKTAGVAVAELDRVQNAWMAEEIANLIRGPYYIDDRRVRAGDIAILVRRKSDADSLVALLNDRGIPVRTKSRGDVFESEEAADVLNVLKAIESPQDRAALTSARAGRILGDTLSCFCSDEAWIAACTDLGETRERYERHGFTAAMRHLLEKRCLTERLLPLARGKRMLRNYEQVLELLQRQAQILKTVGGLIRWFEKERSSGAKKEDERDERIESEDNLVTVDTFHGSKGLEYPIVYIPNAAKKWGISGTYSVGGEANGVTPFYLLPVKAEKDPQILMDEQAEAARLAYVAMTRASRRLVLPLMQKRKKDQQADANTAKNIYWAVAAGEREPQECEFEAGLERMVRDVKADAAGLRALYAGWGVTGASGWTDEEVVNAVFRRNVNAGVTVSAEDAAGPEDETCPVLSAQTPCAARESWQQTSFSGLTRGMTEEVSAEDEVDPEGVKESGQETGMPAGQEGQEGAPLTLLTMPGGTEVGTMLHEVLEKTDFVRAASQTDEELLFAVSRLLRPYGGVFADPEGFSEIAALVSHMVKSVVNAELAPGVFLKNVPMSARFSEMEFLIPVAEPEGGRDKMNSVLLAHTLETLTEALGGTPDYRVPGLAYRDMTGLLTGTVDLLFYAQGKFWIIDWKSNRAADTVQNFNDQAMAREMTRHRYRLQYLLYTVAVKRFLRDRLGRDDVYRLMGGALYVFLRGVRSDAPGSGVVFDRPHPVLVECLDEFFAHGFSQTALKQYADRIRALQNEGGADE